MIDISLVGEVEKKRLVLRSGARPGDFIMVTGSIGGSRAGKHLSFTPRVNEARAIGQRYPIHSMIDISDGLLLDLGRVLDASRVGATIYQNAVPLSTRVSSFQRAVTDGEDFELLFTMAKPYARRLLRDMEKAATPVTFIGEVTPRLHGLRISDEHGHERPIARARRGYLHF